MIEPESKLDVGVDHGSRLQVPPTHLRHKRTVRFKHDVGKKGRCRLGVGPLRKAAIGNQSSKTLGNSRHLGGGG